MWLWEIEISSANSSARSSRAGASFLPSSLSSLSLPWTAMAGIRSLVFAKKYDILLILKQIASQ